MKKLILIILILASKTAFSQSFHVFDIDTNNFPIMRAKFYAFDENGKQITDIDLNDLKITEDGVEREVLSISCPEIKPVEDVSVAMSIDVSSSMSSSKFGDIPLELGKLTATELVNKIVMPPSEFALQKCDDKAYIINDFTIDKQRIIDNIKLINIGDDNDFVEQLLNPSFGLLNILKNGRSEKKAAIIYTDAWWYALSQNELNECIDICNQNNIQFYTIIYSRPEAKPDGIKSSLKLLSESTGGTFYDGVTSKNAAKEISQILQTQIQNINPCVIEWQSELNCLRSKINLSFEYLNQIYNHNFIFPYKGFIHLQFEPASVFFDEPEIGVKEEQKIVVTAINSDFEVTDIFLSESEFDIQPRSFSLSKDQSIELTVSYTAQEKGYNFCNFKFIQNKCESILYAIANHRDKSPIDKTLQIRHPIGGEKFIVGSDTVVIWDGIPPNEKVKIEFSNDSGKTWQTISENALNLLHNWKNLPSPESNNCLVEISQLEIVKESYVLHGIKWEKSYGGSYSDFVASIQKTYDDGYIIAGYSSSNDGDVSENKGYYDYWIIKIDEDGEIEWDRSFGGSNLEQANSIQQTYDGGYIVAGSSNSSNGNLSINQGVEDYWIIKLDKDGEIEWDRSFGGSNHEHAHSIQQTYDGGYIVAGYTASSDGDVSLNNGDYDFWILRLNKNGDLVWEKSYGGSKRDFAYSIQQTVDGGYIIAGFSNSSDGDVSENQGYYDYWILKLDKDGDLEWEKSFGGRRNDIASDIKQTIDSGYILAGYTDSSDGDVSENKGSADYWILKLDKDGELEWERSYGGSSWDEPKSIQQTFDGGYIVAGSSWSQDGDVSENHGDQDYWILKLNQEGKIEWEKSYGGYKNDYARSILQTRDNSFIIAGYSSSSDGDVSENKGYSDFWIVKLYPDEPPVIQADTSDVFSIIIPRAKAKEVDMKTVLRGSFKDSIVVDYLENEEVDFPIRIDTMYIEGANPEDFSFFTDDFPFSIPKASSKEMYFRFQPTALGYREAEVVIETQAETLRYKIYGNCVEPDLFIQNELIDFGEVYLGNQKDTLQAVTIVNTGTSALDITNTKHNLPNAVDFTTLAGGGAFTLNPGDTCKMDLRFKPSEIGKTSGTLEFHYDGLDSPAIIQLLGDGIGSPIIASNQIEQINLLCEYVDTINVVIHNTGNDNLEITNAYFAGTNATEFTLVEEFIFKRLYVGESDTLKVVFTAQTTGYKQAQLIFENNSENAKEYAVEISAVKDESNFTVDNNNFDFIIINENEAATQQIEITNTGTVELNWNDPITKNEFSIRNITPNPTLVGGSSTAEVHFTGATEGIYNESFKLIDKCNNVTIINTRAEVGDKSAASAMLSITNAEGLAGEETHLEIYFRDRENINVAGITAIDYELEFNPTLLNPNDYDVWQIDATTAKIKVENIPINDDENAPIASIPFMVGLGNAEICDLTLSYAVTKGGESEITITNGIFTLLGICEEGGTRLINPTGQAGIINVTPNPAENTIDVEVSLIEKGRTEIAIYNIMGKKVAEILKKRIDNSGTYSYSTDITGLSTGQYYIVLQTPTIRETKQIMILK